MKRLMGWCLAGLVCFCMSGCVSTYDRPLTTSHYNRNNYVAPGNVHYYKDNYPGRNTRPNVHDNRYGYPPPQYGSHPPYNNYNNTQGYARPSSSNVNQQPTGKACKENKDCPSGQRCYGGSARTEGVCKY